jgi:hypothetical protein
MPIDIDPAHVDVAVRRWQDFTGEDAILEGDGQTFAEVAAAKAGTAGDDDDTASSDNRNDAEMPA